MSNEFELKASVRTERGKGASRRLRRLNNDIPAVLYGGGKDPVALTIAHKDIIKATENEAFFSHIITLNVEKKKEQAVIKDLQRHPAKPFILHADFLRVSAKQVIHVRVPIHFLNEEKCVGVRLGGGNLLKTLTEIEVTCLPKDLPEYVEVDVIDLDLGDAVHLTDIALPEGVSSDSLSHGGEDSDLSVAIVQAPKGIAEDEEDAEEESTDETGEEKPDEKSDDD